MNGTIRNSAITNKKSLLRQSVVLFFALFPLVVSTLLTPRNSHGASGKFCSALFTQLSVESQQTFSLQNRNGYWSRAKAAISVASRETLESIFTRISKQELEDLFWRITIGEVKASAQEEIIVRELRHMVEDLGGNVFWSSTDNRRTSIGDAITKYDRKLSEAENLASRVRSLDQSFGKTEIEIVARALAEHLKNSNYPNSKWSDRANRFVSPYYSQIQTILSANRSIRQQLQFIAAVESPLSNALSHRNSAKLTEAQLKALQGLQLTTIDAFAAARSEIKALYGRDVSATQPLLGDDVRITELARRAKVIRITDVHTDLQALGEKNMNELERILDIPIAEKHDVHLQIKNEQFRRETPLLVEVYSSVLRNHVPLNPHYAVRTDWIVTVRHEERRERKWTRDVPDAEGRVTRTETYYDYYTDHFSSTYPMSRTDTMRVNYEELFENRVTPGLNVENLPPLPGPELRGSHAVSASNGKPFVSISDLPRTDIILEQAANTRKIEGSFRSQILESIDLTNQITTDVYKESLKNGELASLRSKLDLEERRLVAVRERLAKYQTLDAASIKMQWANDVEKDFRDRNLALLNLYDHMIARIAHLNEQIRRATPSLVFETSIPDYKVQLEHLKSVRDRNGNLIRDSAIGAGLTGLALFSYNYHPGIMDAIRSLTGTIGP